ncbi:MAG: deoxyribonuclease IV [Eubacteriaceae bacterium]|nr:deoxyribonuclease IV [Eubacteriaceae bacterium]
MSRLHIGCHLSISQGFTAAAKQAAQLEADTFQFFTRNPRGSGSKPLNIEDARAFGAFAESRGFAPILAHAPYIVNMAAYKSETLAAAKELTTSDMALMDILPCHLYNVHPGSRKNLTPEQAFERISRTIDLATAHCSGKTFFLLETMCGKKNEMGSSFEEIREIMDRCGDPQMLGVTLDTCHVYCAGYDIAGDPDGVLTRFDEIIGLEKLKAVHLNDSANPFASHKDRHAKLGEGFIGRQAIIRLINHPALKHLPFILETPNDIAGYGEEIKYLKDNYA